MRTKVRARSLLQSVFAASDNVERPRSDDSVCTVAATLVVAERGDGDNRQHGGILFGAGDPGNGYARRMVRDPPWPLSAGTRTRLFRPDARRHFRLSRAADRTAGISLAEGLADYDPTDGRSGGTSAGFGRSPLAALCRERRRSGRSSAHAGIHRRAASAPARDPPRDPARRTAHYRGVQSLQPVRRQALFRARANDALDRQL